MTTDQRSLTIGPSAIAGSGVFTNEEIKEGEQIYVLSGERCTLNEVLIRVKNGEEAPSDPLGIDDEVYLDLEEFSRTFNHSCEPNAFIRGESELIALRDIKAGEEITYDYSTTMNDNVEKINASGLPVWTAQCNCGSKHCRGIIDQFKTLPKDRREYYVENGYMPDYMLKFFRVTA